MTYIYYNREHQLYKPGAKRIYEKKSDVFLLNDRITQENYTELTALVANKLV